MPSFELLDSCAADAFPAMVWVAGPDRLCSWLNRRWYEFTGGSEPEETGSGWVRHVHPDDLARWHAVYQKAFASNEGFTLEYRLRRQDGQYRSVLESAGPIFAEGRPAGQYLGFCVDITHLAGESQERERLLTEARTASRIRDDFISLVSHGLRTPLNTVLMSAQLLQIGLPDHPEVTEAVGTIVDCVRAQTGLLDELVDTSRVAFGQVELNLLPVDLAETADAALAAIGPEAAEKGVSVRQFVRVRPACLTGDPVRLGRALKHLLSNAVKFTHKGEIAVRVAKVG